MPSFPHPSHVHGKHLTLSGSATKPSRRESRPAGGGVPLVRRRQRQPTNTTTTPGSSPSSGGDSRTASASPTPSVAGNQLTLRAGGFVALLDVADLRYDLSSYGGFLKDIPRRMGQNIALDASVGALTAAFPTIYTKQVSPAALEAYVNAIQCLRAILANPTKAKTPETLCSIYLIMLCQSWLGRTDDQNHNPTRRRAGPALTIQTFCRLVEFVRQPTDDITDIRVAFGGLLIELHVRCQGQFGILLAAALVVGSILCSVLPPTERAATIARMATFPDELVALSAKTHIYRPLGAAFMPVCLVMGCVAVEDKTQLDRMMQCLAVFEADMLQLRWTTWVPSLKSRFFDTLSRISIQRIQTEFLERSLGPLAMR
ncbi:unnamed protein product [Parascedosporium putredinis]|uniref:Uncharacterized protein n=1 Tax=Parascedosporium putredinis TaxID=1442378 RepID=A0A9P1MC74_9PEZI|nr:unnamed protein product [Parascedosporium putredinis]CAI7997334.1 unnamed protein product [Parascedosporium putredinis]